MAGGAGSAGVPPASLLPAAGRVGSTFPPPTTGPARDEAGKMPALPAGNPSRSFSSSARRSGDRLTGQLGGARPDRGELLVLGVDVLGARLDGHAVIRRRHVGAAAVLRAELRIGGLPLLG